MSDEDNVAEPSAALADVDKIRDILFGGHAREYEERFAALDKMMQTRTTDLREVFQSRLQTLESSLAEQVELDELGQALESQQQKIDQLEQAAEALLNQIRSEGSGA